MVDVLAASFARNLSASARAIHTAAGIDRRMIRAEIHDTFVFVANTSILRIPYASIVLSPPGGRGVVFLVGHLNIVAVRFRCRISDSTEL